MTYVHSLLKRHGPGLLLLAAVLGLLAAGPPQVQAQYSVLYSFGTGNPDGAFPAAGLIFDSKGNLYGTTSSTSNTCYGGTVFELSPPSGGVGPWTETVLHCFSDPYSGAAPRSSLIFDSQGNLYGVTTQGGTFDCSDGDGVSCGVVFELSPPSEGGGSWTETVLYGFRGRGDGSTPVGRLIFDSEGNLYGTTSYTWYLESGSGVVFELSPPSGGAGSWTQTVLYTFTGASDGGSPEAGLIFDSKGNLYGTTLYGGAGSGVAFELSPPSGGAGPWTETVLYTFTGASDGGLPFAGLISDSQGNLYGTTEEGGHCAKGTGCGVVFELSPPSGGVGPWTETVLYTFTGASDGGHPVGGLIFNSKGNLYGTALGGRGSCSGGYGCGVIFELSPPTGGGSPWNETVMYTFTGRSDGGSPWAGLISDAQGNLYGTALNGGIGGGSGAGVVFEQGPQIQEPVVTLSPTSLNFGKQIVGTTSAAKTVTLTNTGTATLTINSIATSGDFAIQSKTCGATLAPNAICTVKVTFTPTQAGTRSGALTFTDNAPDSPQSVALSGTGIAPATLTPASATFPKQKVGTTSKPKTFTLTNNQSVTLTNIAISTTGDFAVSATTCGASLGAKKKCTISVTFTPTQTGTRTGQLSASDSASNSPQTATLKGTGY